MKRELTTKALTSPYVVTETMARAFAESTFPSKNIRDISKVDKNGRTVLWIINFNDGWIVVSGDKRTTIILTQNNEGEYHYGDFYLTDEDMQSYDPNMYEGKQTSAHSNYSKDYILMNWGWDGSFDSVECGAVSYDSWSLYSNTLIQYDYSRLMIYNIRTP